MLYLIFAPFGITYEAVQVAANVFIPAWHAQPSPVGCARFPYVVHFFGGGGAVMKGGRLGGATRVAKNKASVCIQLGLVQLDVGMSTTPKCCVWFFNCCPCHRLCTTNRHCSHTILTTWRAFLKSVTGRGCGIKEPESAIFEVS